MQVCGATSDMSLSRAKGSRTDAQPFVESEP
jgi:hypothetical protein